MAGKLAGVSVISVLETADATFLKVYPDYRKFVKSLMVGVIATLVDLFFLFALKNYLDLFYLYAAGTSYLIGMVVSYYLNRKFAFRNTYDKPHYQFGAFALVALSGWVLNNALMFAFVDLLFNNDANLYVMLSKVVVAFIGFVYTFTINKSFTFKIFK
jgi:putative flippase GtrA